MEQSNGGAGGGSVLPMPAPPAAGTPGERRVLAAVSLGGALGAGARWAADGAWPVAPGGFPWTTAAINVTGCAAIGVLMALVACRLGHLPYLRPFLGVGVLGGFTTFSTFALEAVQLSATGHMLTALSYALSTPVLAVLSALVAVRLTTALLSGSPGPSGSSGASGAAT